jgi:hypothetical protein
MLKLDNKQTISQPLSIFQRLMSTDAAFLRILSEAENIPDLADELALVNTWLWPDDLFKSHWNTILNHSSVTDPSSIEVNKWATYLTDAGYSNVLSFTSTGRLN